MLSLSIIIKNILKNYVTKSEKKTINDEILLLQDEVKKLKTDLLEKQGVIETLRKQVIQLQTDTTALQTNNTNVQATVNSFYNAKKQRFTYKGDFGKPFVPAYWSIGNDGFGIRVGDNGSDYGYGELFTTDNGEEEIYCSQYTSTWNSDDFDNPSGLAHRIKLMDRSGNQHFNSVYATQIIFPDGTVMKTAK